MLLDYLCRLLFMLGAVRVVLVGLVAMPMLHHYAKTAKGGTFLQYYWYFVHIVANFAMLDLLYAHRAALETGMFVSFATLALMVYVLMFFIAADEFRTGFSFMQMNEAVEGRTNDITNRLVLQGEWRAMSATIGIFSFILLTLIGAFTGPPFEFFSYLIDWLVSLSPWILWIGAGAAGVVSLYAVYLGVRLLQAFFRDRAMHREMEAETGRKLTHDEFMRRIFEKHQAEQGTASPRLNGGAAAPKRRR